MTLTSIDANEATLASRYLAGQLSDVERAAFERRLRDNPEVVREVEATARLKVGLARLRERGELDELLAPPVWTQRWVPLATAAALVMVVMGVLLSHFHSGDIRPQIMAASVNTLVDQAGSALPVVTTYAIVRKRAENYDAIIQPAAAGAVEMRVLPETLAESGRYRINLSRLNEDRSLQPAAASVDGLQPAADGFVTLFVDTSKLAPGRYRLALIGDVRNGDESPADTFVIRILPSKNN